MLPLKEATAQKHRLAEQQAFNQRMFRGELTEAEYLLYLCQQAAIFESLEHRPLPHPSLARLEKVKQDIIELGTKVYGISEILPSTQRYVLYLESCDEENRLAHIYLNYLAVMFGGQMMKKVVPSSGKMYEFDHMQEALQAVRSVQKDEWAEEVNRGFDFHIAIFEELALYTRNQQHASL